MGCVWHQVCGNGLWGAMMLCWNSFVRHVWYFCLRVTLCSLFALGIFVTGMIGNFGLSAKAAGDTPFFTGVWELKDSSGVRPLVMSDWLIFDGDKPRTWLYLRKGFVAGQQYQFFARNIGSNGVSAAIVDLSKIDDTNMQYRLSANGQVIEQGQARRLSVPNAQKSCLAVDTEVKDLLGTWRVASNKKKRLKLSETVLELDGSKQNVSIQPLRTGQIGLVAAGAPFALFTDAGGDYAVLQILPQGTKSFQGGPIGQHVNFSQEIVVYRSKVNCNKQIADRLKRLGKKRQ